MSLVALGSGHPPAYASTPGSGSCSDSSGELICNIQDELLDFSRTAEGNQSTGISFGDGDTAEDDVFRYVNVFSGSEGTKVDALVTVTSVTNTEQVVMDQDDTGISPGNEAIAIFPGTNGAISLQIDFVEQSSGSAVKMMNLSILVKDLDGPPASRTERAEFTGLTSYVLSNPSDIVVTSDGGTRVFSGGDDLGVTDEEGWVFANFPTASRVGLTAGSTRGGGIGFLFDSSNPWGGVTTSSTPVAQPSYTVSFSLDGGTGSSVNNVSGTGELTFPSGSGQSKNGELISGWSARSGGGGVQVPLGGTYTPISNTTFYAVYGGTVGTPGVTAGTVGESFSSTLTTSGFTSDDLTFTVSSGTLPAGLSLNSSTGAITGTPTSAGSQTLELTATHSLGGAATSSSFTLTVAKGSQTISWSPDTSLTLADSGLTLAATRSTGDGTLGYTVVSQGTTGCAVSGSTLTFSSTGSGANGCEVRPTLTSTSDYEAKTDAASVTFNVLRGTFAVSAPSSKVATSSSSFTDVCVSSCDVSGFAAADEVRLVVSASGGSALSGRVRLTSVTGLTQSLDGYQDDATAASGHAEIAFEGTQAEVNAALETLEYQSPSGGGDETIGISASLAGAAYFAGTGHYYEVISGADKNHADAITAAASRTFNGLNGYLATILTEEENRFIDGKISDRGVWIGGKYNGSVWQWITGPVDDRVDFWTGTNPGSAISGVFAQWEPGEPNGSGVCLSTNYDGGDDDDLGNWDDLGCTASKKWVVEYGGNGGTVLKEASGSFDVGAPTVPAQVSGGSVLAGDGRVTLSWSAPADGGSAITDYVVERSDDGGVTWSTLSDGVSTSTAFVVTGLTNGSSYSFRVSAKNAIGTGSVSSVFTGVPVVQSAGGSGSSDDDDESVESPVVTPRVVGPVVRRGLPAPPVVPAEPRVLDAPPGVSAPLLNSLGVRPSARVGGVPAPLRLSSGGSSEVSVATSSLVLSLRLSEAGSVVARDDEVDEPVVEIGPGARASVSGSGLLPNSSVQVWFPGAGDREFGRLPVSAAGETTGEVNLSAGAGQEPLPVGRQLMQLTGYDADGNQTVVDVPVNVAQGPPTPEPLRESNTLPNMSSGESIATDAGIPTTVRVTAFEQQRSVAVDGNSWAFNLTVDDSANSVSGGQNDVTIRMVQTSTGRVTGEGFQPGTVASVWFFSDPTLMATVIVDETGSFSADFLVDGQFITPGEHTLQLQGVGTDGYIKAANLGVLVQQPASGTTETQANLWLWGSLTIAVILLAFLFLGLIRRHNRGEAQP